MQGDSLQEWHQHLGDEALRLEYPSKYLYIYKSVDI